jgi:lipopolysaccharide biosynthesis protein
MPPAEAGAEYGRVETSTVPVPQEALRDPSRIGAILHLFYEDLWPEMSRYLARIPSLERVYVSIQESASRDLEGRIAAKFPNAMVRRHPNRGRDVLPFLQWLEVAAHEGVALVCKIHTKRSPHLPEGNAWRRDMLDKLLGSEQVIRDIVSSFRADPSLGIVGPAGYVVPSSFFWERNAALVEELCLRMGFDVRGVAFAYVAGTMFWARVDALSPLARIALRNEDFEEEVGLVDGTTAHALERCLPIAARVGGFRVAETEIVAGSVARTIADFVSLPPGALPPGIDRQS